MKKFVSLIFAGCLIVAMQTSCKHEELDEYIVKYIFQNDTELPVTITGYTGMDPEIQETTTILIAPGKKWVDTHYVRGGFGLPFEDYYQIVVNNTEVDVVCESISWEDGNLYNPDTYTLTFDEQYERHYLFVFTDDFFTEIESEK